MPKGPAAAIFKGVCSGHGKCLPGVVHATIQCIPKGGTCEIAPKKSVQTMDGYTNWPPAPLVAKATPIAVTVKINKIAPIVDGDVLQEHKTPCMNTVNTSPCPKEQPAIVPITCNASVYTCAEDAGGIGHQRAPKATSKTVFIEKKAACRVGDPMYPPCLSKITTGSANVFIGG